MPNHPIAILCDSTCDIPQELVERHAIRVIPQYIIWDNQIYLDRVTLQPQEFYQRMETQASRPSSSLVTVADFVQAYQAALDDGAQELMVLTVSSAMSGTYQNALQAAQQVQAPVHVVDARGPTMSLGWQALAAARARDAGADMTGMLAQTAHVRKSLTQLVGMESIEYLQRGGRIGNAAKWVGNLLHVRPLVVINHQTGLVDPLGLARTHRGLVDLLYQKFFSLLPAGERHIAVLHGNVPDEAQALAERIQAEHHPAELLVNITGPVLGINTGPRALALCGYCE